MSAVMWVCYQCRVSLQSAGQCPKCQQSLMRYPPDDQAPAESEDELLHTVKYRGVLNIPPPKQPIPSAAVPSKSSSGSKELLQEAFKDLEDEEDDLQATMRFRKVLKVPQGTAPNPTPTAAPGAVQPAAPTAPPPRNASSSSSKAVKRRKTHTPRASEEDENLLPKLALVAVLCLAIGVLLTTIVLLVVA